MTQVTLSVPEVHCDHCKHSLEGAVGALPGVESVNVAIAEAMIDVSYDSGSLDLETIKQTIEEQGYAVAD
jgi:copper chaperone